MELTRVTEDAENILDLFFSNNQTLVNRVKVLPDISDYERVYVESSLSLPKPSLLLERRTITTRSILNH